MPARIKKRLFQSFGCLLGKEAKQGWLCQTMEKVIDCSHSYHKFALRVHSFFDGLFAGVTDELLVIGELFGELNEGVPENVEMDCVV